MQKKKTFLSLVAITVWNNKVLFLLCTYVFSVYAWQLFAYVCWCVLGMH